MLSRDVSGATTPIPPPEEVIANSLLTGGHIPSESFHQQSFPSSTQITLSLKISGTELLLTASTYQAVSLEVCSWIESAASKP
jgi:hypothetical protein